jgi:hypothetical protein
MKYAEPKDVNYTIQILKQLKDKLKMQESYALRLLEPSINRMLLELDQMLMSHDMENRRAE